MTRLTRAQTAWFGLTNLLKRLYQLEETNQLTVYRQQLLHMASFYRLSLHNWQLVRQPKTQDRLSQVALET